MGRLRKKDLDGNVETLLLALLEQGPSYGYAIVEKLNKRVPGLLNFGEGTIYPVLHRMEERRLITAKWRTGENGRQRKYYRLNRKGKTSLATSRQQWQSLVSVMGAFLGPDRQAAPQS